MIAFLAPYLLKAFCNKTTRINYKWIKLNNLQQRKQHSRSLAGKSIELGPTMLIIGRTAASNRRDDVSSGYSSISEQLSRHEGLVVENYDVDESDGSSSSSSTNEESIYKPNTT